MEICQEINKIMFFNCFQGFLCIQNEDKVVDKVKEKHEKRTRHLTEAIASPCLKNWNPMGGKWKIMKNNDKNVKSFERAKKKQRNVELENSDTALQWGVFTAIVQQDKNVQEGGKTEKSMNKNGTESRTYFMLLSINSHFNPTPLRHLKDECTFVRFYSLAVQLFGLPRKRCHEGK